MGTAILDKEIASWMMRERWVVWGLVGWCVNVVGVLGIKEVNMSESMGRR